MGYLVFEGREVWRTVTVTVVRIVCDGVRWIIAFTLRVQSKIAAFCILSAENFSAIRFLADCETGALATGKSSRASLPGRNDRLLLTIRR